LLVVLAVALMLTGLLLPALSQVRENANRVISASNLRQIGLGIHMFDRDHSALPKSRMLDYYEQPRELTTAFVGPYDRQWDGLGLLYKEQYCGNPEIFYCPGYAGEHTFENYRYDWMKPGPRRIQTNYHYSGHKDWETGTRRQLRDGERLILACDSLREPLHRNHEEGLNALYGDGSVRWLEGNEGLTDESISADDDHFVEVWGLLESRSGR
jgi:prepilin-type processing-associated H-X9-DG protein